MGIIRAITDSVSGSLADQWKDIYTAGPFDEHSVVVPGVLKNKNNGRGSNVYGSDGVISNGSRIFIPENTAAFVFSQGGIESVVATPGNYEYLDGEESIFNNPNVASLIGQVADRVGFGGIPVTEKRIAFVNLREIRHITFGTRGPQMYNDLYYRCDLEVYAYGTFSIQVTDPEVFVRNFVPANVFSYSFDYPAARKQILSEFLQSFIVALNSLSSEFRISQLPSQAQAISQRVSADDLNAGSWPDRFGFKIVKVAIENIEFSPESRELVREFSQKRMSTSAFEETSQRASNIAAQQKIAQGIQDNGLGDGGGMIFGMNMAQSLTPRGEGVSGEPTQSLSLDEQIETLKKLKDLVDAGILSEEEFDAKKKEVMGL